MDTISLTYKELASKLGVKLESARKTAQRKRWKRTVGNDGTARIHVPLDALPVPRTVASDSPGDGHKDSPNPVHELQTRVAVLEAELAGAHDLIKAERHRAISAEAERDRWHEQAQRLASMPQRSWLNRMFARTG